MPVLSGPACVRCGDELDDPSTDMCRACRLAPPPFERAVAYTFYHDPMREAIHALKYGHMRPAAKRMGAMLAQAIEQLADVAPKDLLVIPVPLHRSRRSQRGFNQARLLAMHALRVLKHERPEWRFTLASRTLLRQRATESQANLTPHQRRANVRGAFSVSDRSAVKDRNILLVDDILTTGATARAAAMTLRRAGATSVWVATLARARRIHGRAANNFVLDSSDLHTGQHRAPAHAGSLFDQTSS